MKKLLLPLVAVAVILSWAPAISLGAGLFYVDDGGNVGIGNTTPQSKLDVSGAIYSRLVTATSSSIDWNAGNVQSLTLTSSPTLTFSNGQAGGEYKLILTQDGTGGRAVTWPASIKWVGGIAPMLSANASSTDVVSFVYDGSNYLGSYKLNFSKTATVQVLVIGGGGGGGAQGGGGGAGGYIETSTSVAIDAYSIVVGSGGTAGTETGSPLSGGNGGNSSAFLFTAIGGGGGASDNISSATIGGSGGGGGQSAVQGLGAAGTMGQGNAGGDGNTGYPAGGVANLLGGGGGGAGAVGSNVVYGTGAGAGGDGLASSISGTYVYYSGGGGGGADTRATGTAGAGGGGGGGNGTKGGAGSNGTPNTGGGGGGSGYNGSTVPDGGIGGSGIVIISAPIGTMTATGGSHTTSGGNDIWTFTNSGTFTVISI